MLSFLFQRQGRKRIKLQLDQRKYFGKRLYENKASNRIKQYKIKEKKIKQKASHCLPFYYTLFERNWLFGGNEKGNFVTNRKIDYVENPHKNEKRNTHQRGQNIFGVIVPNRL